MGGEKRERPASEHEGGRQPGRPKEGQVATRKSSEEVLEMTVGYSSGRDRPDCVRGRRLLDRRVLGSLLPSCISGK